MHVYGHYNTFSRFTLLQKEKNRQNAECIFDRSFFFFDRWPEGNAASLIHCQTDMCATAFDERVDTAPAMQPHAHTQANPLCQWHTCMHACTPTRRERERERERERDACIHVCCTGTCFLETGETMYTDMYTYALTHTCMHNCQNAYTTACTRMHIKLGI